MKVFILVAIAVALGKLNGMQHTRAVYVCCMWSQLVYVWCMCGVCVVYVWCMCSIGVLVWYWRGVCVVYVWFKCSVSV